MKRWGLVFVLLVACGGSKATTATTATTVATEIPTVATTSTTFGDRTYVQFDSMMLDIFGAMDVVADNPSSFTPASQESDCNLFVRQVQLINRLPPPPRPRVAAAWATMRSATQATFAACSARPRALTAADWAAVHRDIAVYRAGRDEFAAALTAP